MSEVNVEKTVAYLDQQKVWSIRLRTPEPYGKYCPRTIYVTAIFHKKLDKALKMAWKEFYQRKAYQDDNDKFQESRQTEMIRIAA